MLAAHLHCQQQEQMHKAYIAQMLWYQNYAVYKLAGQKFEHPTWLDMVKPKEQDERSGYEIVQDVASKLRERRKKRERRE